MAGDNSWHPYITDATDIRYLACDNTLLVSPNVDGSSKQDSLDAAYAGKPNAPKLSDKQREFITSLRDTAALSHDDWLMPSLISDPDLSRDQYVLSNRDANEVRGDDDEDSDDAVAESDITTTSKQSIVKGRHLATGNIAGIIRNDTGDLQLSISSRFSAKKTRNSYIPVPLWEDYFLAYMLERVLHIQPLNVDFARDPESSWRMLPILFFPMALDKAVSKGVFRKYVRRSYNDPSPHGRIDVARHIRMNTPFTGSVAYSKREFDTDNPVTELIRHTIEYLDHHSEFTKRALRQDEKTIKNVTSIRQSTPHYEQDDRIKVINDNIRHPVLHPFYRDYRELQQLCIAILRGEGAQFVDATSSMKINGFIFDCASLWEEYLNVVFTEHAELDCKHPNNRERTGHYYLLKKHTENGKKSGRIYPDFLLHNPKTKQVVVADAKYKDGDGMQREDRFQLLAYMLRFDAPSALHLSPINNGTTDKPQAITYDLLSGNPFRSPEERTRSDGRSITMLRLNVSREGIGSYAEYSQTMKKREQEFIAKIAELTDSNTDSSAMG